jgi:hypothetical protein
VILTQCSPSKAMSWRRSGRVRTRLVRDTVLRFLPGRALRWVCGEEQPLRFGWNFGVHLPAPRRQFSKLTAFRGLRQQVGRRGAAVCPFLLAARREVFRSLPETARGFRQAKRCRPLTQAWKTDSKSSKPTSNGSLQTLVGGVANGVTPRRHLRVRSAVQ